MLVRSFFQVAKAIRRQILLYEKRQDASWASTPEGRRGVSRSQVIWIGRVIEQFRAGYEGERS